MASGRSPSAPCSNAQSILQANGRVVELWAGLAEEVGRQIEMYHAEVRTAAQQARNQK